MTEQRVCKYCGESKPLTREHFGSTPSGGFRHKCRACMRDYVREYDSKNPERKQAAIERSMRRSHFAGGERIRIEASLRERDGGNCFYCRKPLSITLHIDHLIPVIKGGKDDLPNLVLACVQCNQEKHNKTPEEYRAWRKLNRLPVLF
jgi:5-methylcytosine-specific restriction endonuclease McrA